MGLLGGVRNRLGRPTGPTGPTGPTTEAVVREDLGRPAGPTALRVIRGLWRAACPTVCPMCDAPLDPAIARAEEPRCSRCEQPLAPVRVAGLWRRTAAGLLDGVVLLCTAGLLNLLLLAWLDPPPLVPDTRGLAAILGLFELDPTVVLRRFTPALVMGALYFGLFWSLSGQTLGHRVLRLRVIDPQGRPPRPWRAALRVLGHGLGLAAGTMGWLWVAFDREKRGLHDHLARTYVVREP
jgi:uncharacterized RDD family membrane protein YckC